MEMKQDQMFKEMGDSLRSYSPEVPSHIYGGIRKKLAWSQFLTFSAGSLNIYYVGIAIAAAGWGWMSFQDISTQSSQLAEHNTTIIKTDRVAQNDDGQVAQFVYSQEKAVKEEINTSDVNSEMVEAVELAKVYKSAKAYTTPKSWENEIPVMISSRTAVLDLKENHPELRIADRLLTLDYDPSDLVGQIVAEQEVLSIKIIEHYTTDTSDGQ